MPPAKKPRPLKCSYRENGSRCPRNGDGNPPLCRAHLLVLQEQVQKERPRASAFADVLGRFAKGQRVSPEDLVSAAAEVFAGIGAAASRPPSQNPQGVYSYFYEYARQQEQRRTQRPPQSPPQVNGDEIARARKVLGFKPGDTINTDDIKRRHRKLALKYHPDRGGSVSKMAELNNAVDVLTSAVAG